MFSRQAGQLDHLVDLGMAPEVVNVFRQMLCNPDQELIHDGIVRFVGSVVSPAVSSVRWAMARHNWDYHPKSSDPPSKGGMMAVIICKECEDHRGTNPSGDEFTVYLPVPPNHDPNIVKNDVITFMVASDGTFVAPGYEDSRIGAALLDVDGTNRRKGWAVMDGTLNGKIYGGSAIDLRNRFPRQWNTSGQNKTTGGAATDSVTVGSHSGSAVDSAVTVATHGVGTSGTGGAHTHTAASGGAHTHTTDSQGAHTHTTENVTVAPHSPHNHAIPTDNIPIGDGTSGTNLVGDRALTENMAEMAHTAHDHEIDSQGGHTHTAASGGAHTHSTDDPGTHTHTTPSLSHTITGSSALSHSAVTVDTVPPFTYLAYMERVNNSRRFLGI